MKKKIAHLIIILVAVFLTAPVHGYGTDSVTSPKREMRAVWLTTFQSLDWPRQKANTPEGRKAQQEELCRILDRLKAVNINTVLLQARVRGTTIYPSAIEPWDECLTGTTGKDPGYDPLEFAIRECHARGMELHAWLVTIPCFKTNAAQRSNSRSVLKTHPRLCIRHQNNWYLNPGLPETADYLSAICRELATNYDLDGIHFDYIRYPENAGQFNDNATFRKYGKGRSKAEWRRENITHCVREMYRTIKAVKPWIKVSSSPIGKYNDLSRFSSYGWNAYSAVYQEAQSWLKEGIHDMLFPMMYFQGNHFYPFALDWKENEYNKVIAPGLGIYFLSPQEKDWDLEVITRELNFIRNIGLGGQAYFRYAYLDANHKGLYDYLKDFYYPYPALTPVCRQPAHAAPARPQNLQNLMQGEEGILSWSDGNGNHDPAAIRYNIYASEHYPVDITKAENLIAVNVDSCSFRYNGIYRLMNGIHFAVTATDRYGYESEPAQLTGDEKDFVAADFLPHNNQHVLLPPLSTQTEFIAILDAENRIIRTVPYSRSIFTKDLARGIYQVRTLSEGGRSYGIGYFIK